jgi:hypothetical protein
VPEKRRDAVHGFSCLSRWDGLVSVSLAPGIEPIRESNIMAKSSRSTTFDLFDKVVISLYDGGILSPAVLERVIRAFAQAEIDWQSTPRGKSVDGRSLHEIVTLTMLPAEVIDSASGSFRTVIEHIGGVTSPASAPNTGATDDGATAGELLAQLSDSARPRKRQRSQRTSGPTKSGGFNPFVNAALPRSRKP